MVDNFATELDPADKTTFLSSHALSIDPSKSEYRAYIFRETNIRSYHGSLGGRTMTKSSLGTNKLAASALTNRANYDVCLLTLTSNTSVFALYKALNLNTLEVAFKFNQGHQGSGQAKLAIEGALPNQLVSFAAIYHHGGGSTTLFTITRTTHDGTSYSHIVRQLAVP